TARLLDVKYNLLKPRHNERYDSTEIMQWTAVLKSVSALEAFRKSYLSKIDPGTILQYTILDRSFPRSIYFCAAAAEEALWRISGSSRHNYTNNADRLIGQLMSELSYINVDDILERGVCPYLTHLQQRLARVGEQIHHIYFAYHAPEIEQRFPEVAL